MLRKTKFEQFIENQIKLIKNNELITLEDVKQLLGIEMFNILNEYYIMPQNKQNYLKDTIDNLKNHQL